MGKARGVRGQRVAGALVAGSLVLCVTAAHAQPAEHAHITYRAPEGCPDEAAFLETVARDGGALVPASDGEPARSFDVAVSVAKSATGRLAVREIDGKVAERSIDGATCDGVVRALAVTLALSLGNAPPAPSTAPPAPPPAAEAPKGPEEPVPPFAAAPVTHEATPEPVDPHDVRRSRWRAGMSVEGSLNGELSSTVGAGAALYLEVYRETPGLVAPSVRIGVERTAASTSTNTLPIQPPGSVSSGFRTTIDISDVIARVDACPLRLMAAQPWASDAVSAQLCGRVDVGQVSMHATSAFEGPTVSSTWAAAGALLRLRWLFPWVFFEGEGGVTFPLRQYHPGTDPGPYPTVQAPSAGGTMGVGCGVLFL